MRNAVARGDRIMGFGHPVYRTADPRSVMLRSIAEGIGGELVEFAKQVETAVEDTLAELKPGRELHTNVEWYAAVVMDRCGLPRDLFTPTFAASRVVGWCAHALEQHARQPHHPPEQPLHRPPAAPAGAGALSRLSEAAKSARRSSSADETRIRETGPAEQVGSDPAQTSSILAIGALSPWRGPSLRMRV